MANQVFWRELQRRNVLRAAALYAGGVWALSQGISRLTPARRSEPGTQRRRFGKWKATGFRISPIAWTHRE